MKTKNKIRNIGAAIGLAGTLLTGCAGGVPGRLTPAGDLFVRQMGNEIARTAVREGIKGQLNPNSRPTNINVYPQQYQQPQQIVVPENVQYINGNFRPVEGYAWINPNQGDFRVRKMNVNEQLEEAVRNGADTIFACDSWVDKNGDGKVDFSEYENISDRFPKGTKRLLVMLYTRADLTGKMVEERLLNSNGELIKLNKIVIGAPLDSENVRTIRNILDIEQLAVGKYSVSIKAGDRQYVAVPLEITE